MATQQINCEYIPPEPESQELFCTKARGYRGFWHGQNRLESKYRYKYSGGLGTYCAKHRPFAIYSAEVNKTFFCYGGSTENNYKKSKKQIGKKQLLHMVSYYDHEKHTVPKPTILLDKWCGDAHDNPVIAIDDEGYIWIFSSSHGNWSTPSYIHKSCKPYQIDKFETIKKTLFAYPQVKYVNNYGFMMPHTIYNKNNNRTICFTKSKDGLNWSETKVLAQIQEGHYQVSYIDNKKIAIAFNYHPIKKGLDDRTNLYFMESRDYGETWTNIRGQKLKLPLEEVTNPALVYDYKSENLNIYMKDLILDKEEQPIIVYISSKGHLPGPENGPRIWNVAHWKDKKWEFKSITESDNNYDMGSIHLEEGELLRLIAPTEKGPQLFNPGGEVAIWSNNNSDEWNMEKQITNNSKFNHTYIRRPINAHSDFYAFWADGNGRQSSPSRLYFANKEGDKIWKLPPIMENDYCQPEKYK